MDVGGGAWVGEGAKYSYASTGSTWRNEAIVTMDTKPAACSPLCGGERHCQQGQGCWVPTSLRSVGERQTRWFISVQLWGSNALCWLHLDRWCFLLHQEKSKSSVRWASEEETFRNEVFWLKKKEKKSSDKLNLACSGDWKRSTWCWAALHSLGKERFWNSSVELLSLKIQKRTFGVYSWYGSIVRGYHCPPFKFSSVKQQPYQI